MAEAIPRMQCTPQHFSYSFTYYRCLCKIFFFYYCTGDVTLNMINELIIIIDGVEDDDPLFTDYMR